MDVDIADPQPRQSVPFDEQQHLPIHGDTGSRQILKRRKDCPSLPQMPERQFANDERVSQHTAGFEQRRDPSSLARR